MSPHLGKGPYMNGVFIDGRRPKSKAEIRRFMENGGVPVLENTSPFSGMDRERLDTFHAAEQPTFVGPDPYRSRDFYGTFFYNRGKNSWQVR